MHPRARSLILIVLSTSLAVIAVLTNPVSSLPRAIITLPLVFVLPGYAITEALLPDYRSDLVKRLALIVGLSLAVTVLTGLVLNWLSISLNTTSWAVSLAGLTAVIALALSGRRAEPTEARVVAPRVIVDARPAFFLGIAVTLALAAFLVARNSALREQTPEFTQLWMLPSSGDDRDTIRVGIRNMESRRSQYILVVKADDAIIGKWTSVEVEPNERWESPLPLPAGKVAALKITALLYRADNPMVPYRHVELWRDQLHE
jgi:uncharacterized membrane protein